jgi:hypothetical protein
MPTFLHTWPCTISISGLVNIGVPVNTSTASTYILSINKNFPVAGQKNDSQGFKDNFRNIKSALETITDGIDDLSTQSISQYRDNDTNGYSFKNPLIKNGNVTAAEPGDGTLPIDYSQASYWPITLLNSGTHELTVTNMPSNSGTGVLLVSISTTTAGTTVLFTTTDPGVTVISLGPEDQPFEIGTSTPYFFKFWNDYSDPYIYIKKVSRDIIDPTLGETISSSVVYGETASFFSFGLGDLTFTEGNQPIIPPARGILLSTYCSGTTKMGVYTDGLGSTYNQLIQINSTDCGYIPPPPPPEHGTLVRTYCTGTTKMGVYNDGTGGTYNQLIEINSLDCGYVLPIVYNEIITAPAFVAVDQSINLVISGGKPNTDFTLTLTSGHGSPGPSQPGTLNSSGSLAFDLAALSFPDTYVFTAVFDGTGHTLTYTVTSSAMWVNWPSLTAAEYTTPYYWYNTTTNIGGYTGAWNQSQSLTNAESTSVIVNTNGNDLNNIGLNIYKVAIETYDNSRPTINIRWTSFDGNVFLDTATAGSGFTVTHESGGTQYLPILGGTAPATPGTYPFTITASAGSQRSTINCNLVVVGLAYNEVINAPGTVLINQAFTVNITGGQPNTAVTFQLKTGPGSPGSVLSAILDSVGSASFNGLILTQIATYGFTANFAANGHVRSYTVNAITPNLWINWPVVGLTTYATYSTPYYLFNGQSDIGGYQGVWYPGQTLSGDQSLIQLVNLRGQGLNTIVNPPQQIAVSTYNNAAPKITVNWTYNDGSIFFDKNSQYGTNGFVVTFENGGKQYLPLFGGIAPATPGTYTFDITASTALQVSTITCSLVVMALGLPYGTLISTHCVGYDKWGTYANGTGGTFDRVIQTYSADCGWPPNEIVSGPATSVVNNPFTVTISHGAPNTSVSWVVAGNTLSATLDSGGNAVFNNIGIAPAYLALGTYTFTLTFAATGHTRTYSVLICQAAGTLLSTYCSGYNKMASYADGQGGTYNQLIESNSTDCGYSPPVYNEVVTGPTDVGVFSGGATITITGGAPNTLVTETRHGLGSITLNGSGSGTFHSFIDAPIYYYFTFNFAATGHTRNLAIAGDYTYDIGLKFELNLTDSQIAFIKMIGTQIYSSNNAFTVTYTATPETRWGFWRVPDVDGLVFWMNAFSPNLPTTLTQEVINALFFSADQQQNNPGGGDYYRARTPYKDHQTVQPPSYGDFDGRPRYSPPW